MPGTEKWEWFWAHDRAVATRDSNGLLVATRPHFRHQPAESREESESRYRSLFENMSERLAHIREMVFDDSGRPIDFVYLAVTVSFGKLTGLQNVVGKRFTEVVPEGKDAQPELLERYSRVALTCDQRDSRSELKPWGCGSPSQPTGRGRDALLLLLITSPHVSGLSMRFFKRKKSTGLFSKVLSSASFRARPVGGHQRKSCDGPYAGLRLSSRSDIEHHRHFPTSLCRPRAPRRVDAPTERRGNGQEL